MNNIWLWSWGPDGSLDTHWHIQALHMADAINVNYVINAKNGIIDIIAYMTYVMDEYVNMGVKRTVRISGLQPDVI